MKLKPNICTEKWLIENPSLPELVSCHLSRVLSNEVGNFHRNVKLLELLLKACGGFRKINFVIWKFLITTYVFRS